MMLFLRLNFFSHAQVAQKNLGTGDNVGVTSFQMHFTTFFNMVLVKRRAVSRLAQTA
jgi:hypothetical protein